MTLSILIVNWNSKDLLRQCLLSIRATCLDLDPQVIVVDGGSFDGCGEMIADEFPEVEFVQSNDNIGFGRSNNLGFRRVTGDMVLLLNPDTEIRPGAVQHLVAELEQRPDAGIVSPRLLNTNFSPQSSVHMLPRPVRQAFDSEFLRRHLSAYGWFAPPFDYHPAETVEVEAVAGACMLLWTKTFRDVGGFTREYFMYAEDMDLCFKIRRAALKVYYVPGAEIVHHGGASSSVQGSTFAAVMMREALTSYMLLNHGRLHARLFRVATASSAVLKMLLLAPGLMSPQAQRRQRRKAAIAASWSVLSWSIGRDSQANAFRVRCSLGET
jgi:GT2 family glycosyltransferase